MPYIALDIGGSKIALCFTDDAGRRHWARVPVGDEADPATVLSDVMEQLRQLGARRGKVDQLAIASAPAIDERGMVSRWPNRPRWNGTPLAAVLAECFGCTVAWCDDGTAAAVADADIVITMGCGDACPIVPGQRHLDAGQPHALGGGRDVHAEIDRRS